MSARLKFLFLSALILCFAFWIRLATIYSLPIYYDEANHLLWARYFAIGSSNYPLLMDGKFLMGILISMFNSNGWITLWIGRAASIVFNITSCAACISGGYFIHSRRAGLLAGIIYSILPFAIFHERQVLADTLMADFGALGIVGVLMLRKKKTVIGTVFTACFFAFAALAKLFGLLYIGIFALAYIFLRSKYPLKQWGILLLSCFVFSSIVFSGILLVGSTRLGYNNQELFGEKIGYVGCPPLLCSSDLQTQIGRLKYFAGSFNDLISPYLGWSLLVLAFLSFIIAPVHKRHLIYFIGSWGIGSLTAFALFAKELPPRYISFITFPLVILAASSIIGIGNSITSKSQSVKVVRLPTFPAVTIIFFLIIAITLEVSNTIPLLIQPAVANLPFHDRNFYFTGVYGNTGFDRAAVEILRREAHSKTPPAVIVNDIPYLMVVSYFDRSRVDVRALSETHPLDIGKWLSESKNIYFLSQTSTLPEPSLITLLNKQTIGTYPVATKTHSYTLHQILDASHPLRYHFFESFFVRPSSIPEQYQILASRLPKDRPLTLLVYPPNQADTLRSLLSNNPLIQIHGIGDTWPLNTSMVHSELFTLTQGRDNVGVILLDAAQGDPHKQIETWLNTNLFKVNEERFGVLHMINYASTKDTPQRYFESMRFGDSIILESIDLIDTVSSPNGVIRLRLNWKTTAPIQQAFKVFTHIFAGNKIIAQHDGQPVGELRPTNTWKVGEKINDQFAIQIPGDTQAGIYTLRIGLYDLNTQNRLAVTRTDGTTGEFFTGGQIVVK